MAEAAKAGVGSFVETFLRMSAVGTSLPLPQIVRQHALAKLTYNIGGRQMQSFEQRVIGFHHAEFRIMQQDQVVDGVEGVSPLPVRAQNLFHQAQVFNRQSQLVGRGDQKFHFIGRVVQAMSAAQSQGPDD